MYKEYNLKGRSWWPFKRIIQELRRYRAVLSPIVSFTGHPLRLVTYSKKNG